MPEALLLARIQFAFTISFHILFPAFTIGLASWLAMLEFLWLKTGKPAYQSLYRFWLKIFAVSFGLGVVSGLVMSFEFGTNWSEFSKATGNVLGPLLGYEVLTAFFLEATFLGIMLFGARSREPWHSLLRDVHGRARHVDFRVLDSGGEQLDAYAGRLHVARRRLLSRRAGSRSCSIRRFPYRFVHMTLAAYLTTCFVVAGVSARYLLRGEFPQRVEAHAAACDRVREHRRAAADHRRRSARTEHGRASTREDRGARGALGNARRRAADTVRVAGRGRPSAIASRSPCRSSAA